MKIGQWPPFWSWLVLGEVGYEMCLFDRLVDFQILSPVDVGTEISFHVPWLSGLEEDYCKQVIMNGSFAGNGHFTKKSQEKIQADFDIPHVLLTTSCTAALELSALAIGIMPGDEVIVPSYTFVSTASAFMRNGAKIIFADIDPETLMIDLNDVRRKISAQTKAIVPVHYGGWACEIEDLETICNDNNISLIEDAAQGFGSEISRGNLGSIGKLGCISFHETKNIHCGLGGALYINEPQMFDRIENIWERGTNRAKMFKGLVDKYSWVEMGSSFYPSEIQAAFLLAQLESIDENMKIRSELAKRYFEKLADVEERGHVKILKNRSQKKWNNHAIVGILNSAEVADRVRIGLKDRGVSAYIGYVPLHSSPMGKRLGWHSDDLPVTNSVAPRVLRFPLHHEMKLDDIDMICDQIDKLTG